MEKMADGVRQRLLAAIALLVALPLLNALYKPALGQLGPAWYWAADAFQFLAMPAIAYALLRGSIQRRSLGLAVAADRHGQGRLDAGLVIFGAGLIALAYLPHRALFWYWSAADFYDPMLRPMPRMALAQVLVAVYMSLGAALVEEVAFRALPWLYLGQVVSPRWRKSVYFLLTVPVFALAHSEQGPAGCLAAAWFGVLAAAFYLRFGNLWPVVAGHFAVDLAIFGPW